ncbi:hypothetical protein [Prochlorococcus marinus]|nr:hypothetical protein [Prochlorococcus marinus]ABM78766.1 Hypothetical protein P9303_20241 [Prochlorococcus marinus str. MIT 9303]
MGDLSNLRRPSNLQFPSHDPLRAFAVEVLSLRNQALMDRTGQQGLALLPDRIAEMVALITMVITRLSQFYYFRNADSSFPSV